MKKSAYIEGNHIPYKVSNGQVFIAGEKLNDVIAREFGKEASSVYISIVINEVSPELKVSSHPKQEEKCEEVAGEVIGDIQQSNEESEEN